MADSVRATKSGLARDAQEKIQSKFDPALAKQCLEWIKDVIGDEGMCTEGTEDNVVNMLQDGRRLEKLMKRLKNPECDVSRNVNPGVKAKWNDRLSVFNDYAKKKGVPDLSIFTPENITETTNVPQVLTCISALASKCQNEAGIGGFGPKEAERNERHFTQEQLAKGKSVIGLQMGSNKGASQSGMIMGKPRGIID